MASGGASVGGIVLAGGRGQRMGGADKGWVLWQGRPLVEQVIERLRPQVQSIVISANRHLERYAALGWPVVEDDSARFGHFNGPLVGMHAGLQRCAADWAVIVPCDAPALPTDLVARLLAAALPAGRPAVASLAGRSEPVFCLLPATVLPALAAALTAGERRPAHFLDAQAAIHVPFDDAAAAFANLNAPGPGVTLPP